MFERHPPRMPPGEGPPPRSLVWLWGFWLFAAAATGALVVSLYAPYPADRAFRILAGVLLVAGGIHNGRVVAFKRKSRSLYSTFAPDALLTQRQTGWSAIALGVVLAASAVVGL